MKRVEYSIMDKKTPLKQWIDSHGIKQRWLCEQTGITQAWMSKIVNGKEPKVGDGIRIADALGADVKDFWGKVSK